MSLITNNSPPSEVPPVQPFEEIVENMQKTLDQPSADKKAQGAFASMQMEDPQSKTPVLSKRTVIDMAQKAENQEQLGLEDSVSNTPSKKHKNNEGMGSSVVSNLAKTVYDNHTTGNNIQAVKDLEEQLGKEKDPNKKLCLLLALASIFNDLGEHKLATKTAFKGKTIANQSGIRFYPRDARDIFSVKGLNEQYELAASKLKSYEIEIEHAKAYNDLRQYQNALSILSHNCENLLLHARIDAKKEGHQNALSELNKIESSLDNATSTIKIIEDADIQMRKLERQSEVQNLNFEIEKLHISSEQMRAWNGLVKHQEARLNGSKKHLLLEKLLKKTNSFSLTNNNAIFYDIIAGYLLEYAKAQYKLGEYQEALTVLDSFSSIAPQAKFTEEKRRLLSAIAKSLEL